MLRKDEAGLDHVQIMDFCRIDVRQCCRERVGLFLVIAFYTDSVAWVEDGFEEG
jgi:hypothetical protein